jgi:hypothetical protein
MPRDMAKRIAAAFHRNAMLGQPGIYPSAPPASGW